jgi:hypothetical protein
MNLFDTIRRLFSDQDFASPLRDNGQPAFSPVRLIKANAEKRKAFVGEYVVLRSAAQAGKAEIFFVDEAHFLADVELRRQRVLRGEPGLLDSSSPRMGEKASYYSAVYLETGEVEAMPKAIYYILPLLMITFFLFP